MNSEDKILQAAIKLAIKQGYRNIKRDEIAQKAKLSAALINHYYGSIKNLQVEVMKYAVENAGWEPSTVIGGGALYGLLVQGLALRDPIALKAAPSVKNEAAQYILRP